MLKTDSGDDITVPLLLLVMTSLAYRAQAHDGTWDLTVNAVYAMNMVAFAVGVVELRVFGLRA